MKSIAKSMNGHFYASILCLVLSFSLMSFQTEELNLMEESAPTASFSVQNNGCTGPCAILFDNRSTGAISYHWDFGDGSYSCEENPSHTYTNPGTYRVTLKVIGISSTAEIIGTVDVIGI